MTSWCGSKWFSCVDILIYSRWQQAPSQCEKGGLKIFSTVLTVNAVSKLAN